MPEIVLRLLKNKATQSHEIKIKKQVFRVLVLQFVKKRVKNHKSKTNTKSYNNEILICIIYEHKLEQYKHKTEFHPQFTIIP